MPIYKYECEECGNEIEVIQSMVAGIPFCCGKPMSKLPTFPAMIKKKIGGVPIRSRGYKEGYSKEYLKGMAELSQSE